MELLERSSALDELDAALAGGAGLVLVAGEAGIGKSALVRRFAERHRDGALFLTGACDPLLTPRPLGPLHDIARQTGGRLADLLAAQALREDVFSAFLDELELDRWQAVVVEDVHWADDATLDLLTLLARRPDRLAATLVVTYRDDEFREDHPLRAVLGALSGAVASGSVRRLDLQPLSEDAVAELARSAGRPELARGAERPGAGLHALTGGNPLLVTELLAAGGPGVPATVRDLVLTRLAALPAAARELVRWLAVIPGRAELWLVEQGPGADWPVLESGVAGGLLVVADETVGFRHELIRRAVEDALPAVRRRELNRHVLRVLVGAADRGVDVARLVHHARQADDADAVLRYAPEAARRAAAVSAHREALGHYEAALRYASQLPATARAELHEGYAFHTYLLGRSAEAISARLAALDIWERAGRTDKVGESLRWLSRLYWWVGRRADAEAAAARAITVLEADEPGHELAMAYSNQSQLDMLANRTRASVSWGTRAIELAERLHDHEALAHAMTNIGSARLNRDDHEGRADLERGLQVAVGAGLVDDAIRALSNLSNYTVVCHDHQQARDVLDRALAFAREHDLVGYIPNLIGHRARLLLDEGDWAGAQQDAAAVLGEWSSTVAKPVDALVVLGRIQAHRGDPAASRTLQKADTHAFVLAELQNIGPVTAASAELAWLDGDLERSAAEAARGFDLALAAGHPWYVGELATWLWRAGALTEIPPGAAEPYRLLLTGDWRGAARAWAVLGCPYEQALALANADEDDALARSLRLLDDLGAERAARQLRQELHRRGRRGVPRGPRSATAANPAGLTSRQLEVLRLVAAGLGNAEIAARLTLSVKTVEHHISAVLIKLAVSSRLEAALAARRLGIVAPQDEGRGTPS